MSYPTTNNQHGGTYDPGSAAPVYPVQSRSEEQHGGEYSPGSAGPIYEDRTARPSYDSPTTVQSQFSGHRVPRRPVPAMQAANPTFPQSMTPPSYPPYSHYSAHPGAAYESVPIPPAYATPQSDSRIGYYPPYPEQPQGQYVHRVPAQPVRDSSQPVPCAPPVPGGSNFSGYNSQPQASAYGQYANPSRHGGHLQWRGIVDVEATTQIDDTTTTQNDPRHHHIPLKGYKNLFGRVTAIRLFKFPHFFKPADYVYTSLETFRNKDSMLRFREGVLDDRYISPYNGRTEELVVQTVDTIYNNSSSEGTWNRTFIRDISPWHLRLANWPESHIPYIERTEGQVTFWQNAFKAVKYVPAAIALVAVIAFPGNVEGEVRNGGRYDAFPYKFHGYSKVARNLLEERITRKRVNLGQKTQAIMTNRLLNPRKICLIDMEPSPRNPDGVKTIDYEEGMALPYLFAAYTAEQFPDWSDEHKEQMIRMAAKATRDHGLAAFWISSCCIDTSLDRRLANGKVIQEDVYRISDVIRGAEVTVILLGPPSTGNTEANNEERRLGERLRQWGSRLWTFPEVLLSTGDTIKVYNIGVPEPLIIHKNQFASLVWPDKDVSRQLIDHHQGTLKLSRLELVTIALECLFSRQHGTFLPGDHSYALMGLLRLRPQVDETDSGFQAFARLSLANDSDLLLERLSCVLPYNPDQPWHTMDDAYGASLWDIYPSCQIAGIGDDNTIIVDGARGANVRWKSFASVHVLRRWSWKRLLFRMLLHTSSMALLVGAILLWIADWIHMKERKAAGTLMSPFSALGDFEVPGFGDLGIHEVLKNLENDALDIIQDIVRIVVDADVIKSFGVIFMIWALSMAVFAPVAIRTLYGGKLWNTQPWLFGFEGYLSITQIEHLIFGDERNRLRWHPSGSPLSRHQVDDSWKGGHCEPVDPTTDPAVKTMVEAAKTSKLGDQKIFTLVDTNTMTVTMFQAARPPVCFLLLGAEGGMQRAVGCSFDWTTGILYRETVLRMETSCRDKMDLVSRARISLEKRRNPGVQQAPQRPRYKVTASSEKFARRTETESG